jgi:adenosine deaminase
MPKGGDLHHHYTGSVYAETFLNYVVENDLFLNKNTLEVKKQITPAGEWTKFSALTKSELGAFKQKLMQKWSVKDYNGVSYPSDKQFFETFPAFGVAADETVKEGLFELKQRALSENVSYLETMFMNVPCIVGFGNEDAMNAKLRSYAMNKDEAGAIAFMDSLYSMLNAGVKKCAIDFVKNTVENLHDGLKMDDDKFTIRYQTYVNRSREPIFLFKDILAAFFAAQESPLIVGVNIVAPEDGEVSMKDYWLHMVMFKFCGARFKDVRYSMHAGELALGLVKPEDLTWHISAAVNIAGAHRVGHGVDIAWEKDSYGLLKKMASKPVPVEINLTSNEFILKIKGDQHPISLYRQFKVPIVISTDDAGVLRSNLTQQYVLLANRYPDISYKEIKRLVYNSIEYSFIEDKISKEKLRKDLDRRFLEFESKFESLPAK